MPSIKISIVLAIICVFLMFEESTQKSSNEKTISLRQSSVNICDDTVIDDAVRVSADDDMLLFKGKRFWVFSAKTSGISGDREISEYFKEGDGLQDLEASWVNLGFNKHNPNSGQIFLLKENKLHVYNVTFKLDSDGFDMTADFAGKLEMNKDVWEGMHGYDLKRPLNTVTQLNTIDNKEDVSDTRHDLLVLSQNSRHERIYNVLHPSGDGLHKYWSPFDMLSLKSERDSKQLSCFDPKTRNMSYWAGKPSEGILRNVLDIKALEYFPTGDRVYAFGSKDYCVVVIKSSAQELKCVKQSIRQLLNCKTPSATTTAPGSQTAGPQTAGPQTAGPQSSVSPITVKPTENASLQLKCQSIYYLIGVLIIVFIF